VALVNEGRWAEARGVWELLVLLQPDSAAYRQRLERTQARIAEATAERLQAAKKARESGDVEQAVLLYLRVLSVDPQNAAAAQALRELEYERVKQAQLGRPPRVLAASRAANGKNDPRPAATPSANELSEIELGVALMKQGDYAGSVLALERYLRRNPRDEHARGQLADAYYQLGLALMKEGRKDEALGDLEKAQGLGPSDPAQVGKAIQSARKALGEDYYRLGLQTFNSSIDQAIALWERSLHYDPTHVQARVRLEGARRAQRTMQQIEQSSEEKK